MVDLFESCRVVNDQLTRGDEAGARERLIRLLDQLRLADVEYTPLVNHLIRKVGLFPYLESETSAWQERFVAHAFKADVGESELVTLHREQSRLLGELLDGKSIAVSAPTSFGKSFVVDAFIAIRSPTNVVILVPTIALADETRRRLQRKFGASYKIITTANQTLAARNILVFPQERAHSYVDALNEIDMLIVDEFYKASAAFDRERAPALINAMIRLSKIARQRYFLAPHIDRLEATALTEGVKFLRLDFNTVFLEKAELYREIGRSETRKSAALLSILTQHRGKTLVYAGTYTNVAKVATLLLDEMQPKAEKLLQQCAYWLSRHYGPNWILPKLVTRGVGLHTGQLHRSLSQIQVRLFEEPDGLSQLVSTSSIIEGVNTSAENVVLWSNRTGKARISDFTYRNIIGRGGRMFRHFVGRVFILEEPPTEEETTLQLDLPDELLGLLEQPITDTQYTPDQVARIEAYEREMTDLVGALNLEDLQRNALLQSSDSSLILKIAREVARDARRWSGLRYLNSNAPESWTQSLYNLIKLQPGVWEAPWSKFVHFVKVLAGNWTRTLPELLEDLEEDDIGIDEFFKLERNATFRLAALIGDVQTIYNRVHPSHAIDLTPAIARVSHAFLPAIVFQLEEYGLPRMLSRQIHAAGILDLESAELDLYDVLERFRELTLDGLVSLLPDLDNFDLYILQHFFDGIGKANAVP